MASRNSRRRTVVKAGFFLFAGYLVGTTSNWLLLPIPFVIALLVFRGWLVHKPAECDLRDRVAGSIIHRRGEYVHIALAKGAALRFRSPPSPHSNAKLQPVL